jgi:RNA binding exosome subunit
VLLAHSARLEAFCFPTEEPEKVLLALKALTSIKPVKRSAETNFGSKMSVFTVKTQKEQQIKKTTQKMSGLGLNLPSMVTDEGFLTVMLDKQKAFQGEIKRGKGIKFCVRLAGFPKTRQNFLKNAEKLFNGSKK